jgi:putative endonuclease
MTDHLELGRKGETIAVDFLVANGYEILETNWKLGRNEIDVIALSGKLLVIAEVKTRQSDFFGQPELSVTPAKQRILVRAANAYVRYKNRTEEVRFDVIAILLKEGTPQVNHIRDAFYPTL